MTTRRPKLLEMTGAGHARFEFDELLRHLAAIGFAALIAWAIVGAVGLSSGYLQIEPHQVLKFFLAVLILVFSRRTYWEMREWRWKRVSAEERFGFASPLWENPRAAEHPASSEIPDAPDTPEAAAVATDPQQVAQ